MIRRLVLLGLLVQLVLLLTPGAALAASSEINLADTTFVMFSAALVMLMTPGLALFYGGMVARHNVLSMLMKNFIMIAVVSVQWVLIGYSLAFGTDHFSLIGSLEWLGLQGVGAAPNPDYAATIPHQAFMLFQLMFAVITPALISGAVAERVRFPAFVLFAALWATVVYDPLAHWVWGVGGWLRELGALDFAGGTVVHISSGVSALVFALVLGKRKGYGRVPMPPHHLPMTVLGAGLLWFGWFGFNAGSALSANGLAVNAMLVTNTSAAAGTLGWVLAEWLRHGKPTALGAASGAVVGLVAITPGAGFVGPLAAVAIGFVGGILSYTAVAAVKPKLGYDDSLDVFGCHGIGGIWGAIATGIFASKAINEAGADGLIYGNAGLVGIQAISVAATAIFAVVATLAILKAVDVLVGLRVSEEEEQHGLDLTQHGESAYSGFPHGYVSSSVGRPAGQMAGD